ncbi:hypothetical protein PTKIN_Ptkin13bG0172900 [Pterospermum kingtungense]
MSQAKLRTHVPKFGDWDNDNLPYTTYFENARKEKAGTRMNPNDPEENPEAFMYMKGGLESNCVSQPVLEVPLAVDSNNSISVDAQSRQKGPNRNGSYDDHKKSGRSRSHNRNRSMALESASEKSNSDHPFMHRRANSSQKNARAARRSSFSSSISTQSTRGSGRYQLDGNNHHRTASIPKFGEWDETDPKSGEGYSAIFNKVKEEKQATSAPPQPCNYSEYHGSKSPTPSFCSKIFCCFFPHGSD